MGGTFDVVTTKVIAANAYSLFIDKVVPSDEAPTASQVDLLKDVTEREKVLRDEETEILHDENGNVVDVEQVD